MEEYTTLVQANAYLMAQLHASNAGYLAPSGEMHARRLANRVERSTGGSERCSMKQSRANPGRFSSTKEKRQGLRSLSVASTAASIHESASEGEEIHDNKGPAAFDSN